MGIAWALARVRHYDAPFCTALTARAKASLAPELLAPAPRPLPGPQQPVLDDPQEPSDGAVAAAAAAPAAPAAATAATAGGSGSTAGSSSSSSSRMPSRDLACLAMALVDFGHYDAELFGMIAGVLERRLRRQGSREQRAGPQAEGDGVGRRGDGLLEGAAGGVGGAGGGAAAGEGLSRRQVVNILWAMAVVQHYDESAVSAAARWLNRRGVQSLGFPGEFVSGGWERRREDLGALGVLGSWHARPLFGCRLSLPRQRKGKVGLRTTNGTLVRCCRPAPHWPSHLPSQVWSSCTRPTCSSLTCTAV